MANYTIWVLGADGKRLAATSDFDITLTLAVNAFGAATIRLAADALPIHLAARVDARLAIWRRAEGHQLLLGQTHWLVRRARVYRADSGRLELELVAYSAAHLLWRRWVSYPASSSQAEKSDLADDLAKAIVRENLGNQATDTDRDLGEYLRVEGDKGDGPLVSIAFAYRRVGDVLQDVAARAEAAGTRLYFDVLRDNAGDHFIFRTWTMLRGMDRSPGGDAPLHLSVERGTLLDAERILDWTNEVNYAYALGVGQKSARLVGEAGDDLAILKSPYNRMELIRQAGNIDDQATLDGEAELLVAGGRAREVLVATFAEQEGLRAGLDINLGDLVSFSFAGLGGTAILDRLQYKVSRGKEEVKASLADLNG